jgi:Tfp pilus assembly protein PilE
MARAAGSVSRTSAQIASDTYSQLTDKAARLHAEADLATEEAAFALRKYVLKGGAAEDLTVGASGNDNFLA